MLARLVPGVIAIAACVPTGPAAEPPAVAALPDERCDGPPEIGAPAGFRHRRSRAIALGAPRHRGIDLVVDTAADPQMLRGELSYSVIDKSLQDEDVALFACVDAAWTTLGIVRSGDEGRVELALAGSARLPVGMRDLYLGVPGDGTGARFLAVVAPPTVAVAVSDVDGTLTSSENALLLPDPGVHAGAAEAWTALADHFVPVYVTARPRMFTDATRAWLAEHGLPRGAVRLAPRLLMPGAATVEYKAGVLEQLAAHVPIAIGVGNRASDVEAYARVGLPGERVLIKLPEYDDELAAPLAAGRATGFVAYPGPLAAF